MEDFNDFTVVQSAVRTIFGAREFFVENGRDASNDVLKHYWPPLAASS